MPNSKKRRPNGARTSKPRGKWFWDWQGVPKAWRALEPRFRRMCKGREHAVPEWCKGVFRGV